MASAEQIAAFGNLRALGQLGETAECLGHARQWIEQMGDIERIIWSDPSMRGGTARLADAQDKMIRCCLNAAEDAYDAVGRLRSCKRDIDECG
jgi:catabolite regulation protein CreA